MNTNISQTLLEASADLLELRWYRVRCKLLNTRSLPGKTPPTFVVMQAIVKRINTVMTAREGGAEPIVLFHLPDKNFKFKAHQGQVLDLHLLFFKTSLDNLLHWLELFVSYFEQDGFKSMDNSWNDKGPLNYRLLATPKVDERSFHVLLDENNFQKTKGEIFLQFLNPLPFKPEKGWNRTFLSNEKFIKLFERRFSKLFGKNILFKGKCDEFSILPYYWRFVQVPHRSVSQPGTIQYIKGCVGPLYIKGDFKNLLPFLILGSEVHCGGKLGNAQGYFKLIEDAPPYFLKFFPDKKRLLRTILEVQDRYDRPLETVQQTEALILNEDQFVEELYSELMENRVTMQPSDAFIIHKDDGGQRLLEKLGIKELILHHYLLKTITDIFDRFFEETSIGFRKGISREKAIEMVKQAVAEGYRFVIESDIADFFPSVKLDKLFALLDFYIPEKDVLLKSLLKKCCSTGYVLNGIFHERKQGLAQGSPLSPILANLYLDAFDEYVQQLGVKMVRYADDFIILTREYEQAQQVFRDIKNYLAGLGLRTKSEKTFIKPLEKGFQFLGITFRHSEVVVLPEEEYKRLKKPLYITESYLFLSLNGEALDILRNGKPIQTIPLRRLSEIIVMGKAAFSTAVLRKCVERNIPFTITLGSGYYITTVKPDSKNYYGLAHVHAQRYFSLNDHENLAIAKEIASIKVQNAITLFRQKYIAGNNKIISSLNQTVPKIEQAANLNQVRGAEGMAARVYYQGINILIDNQKFHIRKRQRKKPDPINSLLNLGYYLLYGRINATIRALGLNPYLGFLHSPGDSYESLVADLQELFRARIDRFVIRLINLRIIDIKDFKDTGRGSYLKPEAKKRFLHHFEREMEKTSGQEKLPLRDQIHYQCLILKKWVVEECSLTFYRWKP